MPRLNGRFSLLDAQSLFVRRTSVPLHLLSRSQCLPLLNRRASTSTKSTRATRLLAKPMRYNPPSHPSVVKRARPTPQYYGPELTREQKVAQEEKWYPNMMPPEGTFLHWFLSDRSLHLWITMVSIPIIRQMGPLLLTLQLKPFPSQSTLTCLGMIAMWENWCLSTIFRDSLPLRENILRHPVDSAWQFFFAWQRSLEEGCTDSIERKDRRNNDITKQASYRKAHGEEKEQQVEFWPEFERRYGKMVIDEKTGRLVDENTLPNKGVRKESKLWFGVF